MSNNLPENKHIFSDDYYEVLGVGRGEDKKAIKRAYRKLAIKHHPDKNPNDSENAEERFKRIGEAYSVLSDDKKKKMYDQFGKPGLKGGMGGPQVDPRDIFKMFFSGGDDPFGSSFGFENLFGGNSGGFGGPGMNFSFGGMPGGGMRGGPFGGHSHGRRRQAAKEGPIPNGTSVYTCLLDSAEYNHLNGIIKGYNPQKQRFVIDISHCHKGKDQISLKPEKICQVVQDCLTHGLSKEEFNGLQCYIAGYKQGNEGDEIRARCVMSNDNSWKSFKISNLLIPNGTVVRLTGLQGKPEWNGQYGKISDWDDEKGRYEIMLNSRKKVRVKPNNLRV